MVIIVIMILIALAIFFALYVYADVLMRRWAQDWHLSTETHADETNFENDRETPPVVQTTAVTYKKLFPEPVKPEDHIPTPPREPIAPQVNRGPTLDQLKNLIDNGRLQAAYRATNAMPGHPLSTKRAHGWALIVRRGMSCRRSRIGWALHGLAVELRLHSDYASFTEIYFLALDVEEFCRDRGFPCPGLRQRLTDCFPRLSAGHQPEAAARLRNGLDRQSKG